jgi:hypothetical protein
LRSWASFRWYQERRLPFSCFTLLNSFSVVPTALGPIFMFCAPRLIFDGTEGVVIFSGTEVVGSCFHLLRSRTCFQRYRGRRVPFSSFALPDSFSVVSRASGPVFFFCAPALIFDGSDDVGIGFHVLCNRTSFRRYRGRRVPLSCFALPDSFSAVHRASGPIFMFFAPRLIFGASGGVRSRFHVLRSRTRFRRYQGRRLPFSCFARQD